MHLNTIQLTLAKLRVLNKVIKASDFSITTIASLTTLLDKYKKASDSRIKHKGNKRLLHKERSNTSC